MTVQPVEAVDLLKILGLRDRYGVLSVYADADPRERVARRPAWVVAVENGLSEIRERVKSNGDRALWTAVFRRIEELEPELSALLDPRRPGRGRALFVTVEGGELHSVSLQMPLPNRVVLDEIAHSTPLLAALDRGRSAGLVVVSQSAVRALEQRLGAVTELTTFTLESDTSDWREMRGPAAANPALAQHAAPQRDRFERRLDDHRARLLEAAGAEIGAIAGKRAWDRVVVVGDPRVAEPLVDAVSREGVDVALVDRTLRGLSSAEIGEALAPELEEASRRREARLVARARDAALSGGAGSLGLADVLTALGEGRVEHLLFEEGREYRGARAPDGRLVPEGVAPPGIDARELTPEPALTAHMVERALATDALVTPLPSEAAAELAEHDGIAALLRW